MLVCGTSAGPLLEAGRHGRLTQYPIAIRLDVTFPDRCPPGVRPWRRHSGALLKLGTGAQRLIVVSGMRHV